MRSTLDFLTSNSHWLAAGALLTFIGSFGQTFFISVFAGEIQAAFGLSHGSWGAIYAIGTTVAAAIMVWAGGLTDTYRARSLGVISVSGLGLACLFMAFNTYVLLLPLVVLGLRLMGQGMSTHIAIVAMARWFVATRGKALAIATLGVAAGEMILPVLFVFLLDLVDWRLLWVGVACVCFASLPVLYHLLKTERVPNTDTDEDQRAGIGNHHWTRTEAFRHPLFWYIVPAILGLSAFGTALLFHQVHFSAIKGISHLAFVSLLPIYTSVAILSMIGSGIALDRFGTRKMLPFYQLPLVIGFVVFATGQGIPAMALAFALVALTTGSNSTLPNAFWADAYGTAHIGSIKAMATAVMVLGSALGPFLTGMLIDFGVGLETQYVGVAIYFLFTTGLLYHGVTRYFVEEPA